MLDQFGGLPGCRMLLQVSGGTDNGQDFIGRDAHGNHVLLDQVSRLTPTQINLWNSKLAQVVSAWLKDMQAVGQDGQGVLKAYQATNGQEI